MGNSESTSGDTHESFVHGSSRHTGYPVDTDHHQQQHSAYSRNSDIQHEPPTSAGHSIGTTHQMKHQYKHIADNFNSLEEVLPFFFFFSLHHMPSSKVLLPFLLVLPLDTILIEVCF